MNRKSQSEALPALSPLEGEVMQIIWRDGPCTAESVRPRLARALKESTVRTVLRRIEEKGYLTHDLDGRTFVFRAAQRPPEVAANGMKRLARLLFEGSMADLLVGLVEEKALDAADIAEAARRIAESRARREG
jgi:BlaI family transcriptional regulator, penicillinase repressor